VLAAGALVPAAAGEVTVRPEPLDEPLANPFKGFCPYAATFHQSPAIPQTLFYDDVTWRKLEPRERGKIDWSALEGDWERHVRLGRRAGFRLKCADPWTDDEVDVPDWLVAAGVRVRPYRIDGGKGKAPDWDSPAFLREHDRLIASLGRRYNKDPRVAWIDVGSYGIWGEWHVWRNEHLAARRESKKRILDAYLKAFPDKPLVIAFDDRFATGYLASKGGGVRNDNLGRPDENAWYLEAMNAVSKTILGEQFKRGIVTGEFGNSERGAREALTARFDQNMRFVERTHWSFIGPAGGSLPVAKGELLSRAKALHMKLGYRFRFKEVRHPGAAKRGFTLNLRATVVNDGVAPFYFGWKPAVVFIDSGGRVRAEVALGDPAWDPGAWLPGERELALGVKVPRTLPAGRYSLGFGIIDPATKRPGIRLAQKGRLPSGWYPIAGVRVTR